MASIPVPLATQETVHGVGLTCRTDGTEDKSLAVWVEVSIGEESVLLTPEQAETLAVAVIKHAAHSRLTWDTIGVV